MIYSNLGVSALKVSRIGFGCMSLPPDEKMAIPVLDKAIALDINYLDTADIYHDGLNEIIIGKAIKGKRDNVIVASKAGNVRNRNGGLDWNPSKKHILKCAEDSLRRLQTDYIDLYQLHGGTVHDNINESVEAFELLKQQGKIRYYGISSIRPNVIREYIKRSSIVSVMTQYSLADRRPEEETLGLLHKHNIAVMIRGCVAQGLLIGKPLKPYLDYSSEEVSQMANAVLGLSGTDRTPTQTAIKYVLQNKAVTSAVVGMRTLEQVEEAVDTVNAPDLSPSELQSFKNVLKPNVYKEHR
ncbi:MAG TPA: aldo/keto reductase [Flavitalea sp.]|nr:aldo/keto reductase [Flavitalea sp.]